MYSNDRLEEDRYVDKVECAKLLTAARRGTGSTMPAVVDPVPVRSRVATTKGFAFFGRVAARRVAVILPALVVVVGLAIGVTSGSSVTQATTQSSQDTQSVSIVGGVVLALVSFLAAYCGGYVAARMSRVEGVKQGLGVWVRTIVVAVVVAVAAAVAGAKYDVLRSLSSFLRQPVDQGELTTGGVIALVALLVISLLGALSGGGAGVRYRRRLESHAPASPDVSAPARRGAGARR